MGLDPATTRSISNLLHRLAEKQSPRLVLALRPQDHVPDWISHVVLVGKSQQILQQGTKPEITAMLQAWQKMPLKGHRTPKDAEKKDRLLEFRAHLESGNLDEQLLYDFSLDHSRKSYAQGPASIGGEALIEMDGVRVQYGDKVVLGDWQQQLHNKVGSGLHWRVRRGQRWAILGANGSGKTTLLSLITSDHPQTYSQPIKMFGRSRLPEAGQPGISIFELQARLGHSSPEIHAFFPRQLTIREALESAFAETFLSKPKLDYEKDLDVSAALRAFKEELDPNAANEDATSVVSVDNSLLPRLEPEGSRRLRKPTSDFYNPLEYQVEYADHVTFGQLTTAQQRIVLFLRALIHKPDVVILDEPFSGLTASQRDKCLHFLEMGEEKLGHHIPRGIPTRLHGLSDEQALVLISHVKEEIPDSVRYFMRLPSESGAGSESVDFRTGMLKNTSVLSDSKIWDQVWSPANEFPAISDKTAVFGETKSIAHDDFERFGYCTI